MKFVISSSALSAKLQMLGRVVAGKNTLQILDCFLIEIQGETLTVTASDADCRLSSTLPLIESESDVTFAVNAKTLQDAMKEMPDQPLQFFLNEETLELSVLYLNGHYKCIAESADPYPAPGTLDDSEQSFSIRAQLLLNGTQHTLFAAPDDTFRPVMTGIFFDIKEEKLTTVATDGHKLVRDTLFPIADATPGSFILPKKPAAILRNILAKEEGVVTVRYDSRAAFFSSTEYTLQCRLLEGRYPNYASVIPQDNHIIVTIDRAALAAAMRRVLVFSSEQTSLVRMQFDTGKVVLSCQNVDFSMSAEESLICDFSGDPLTIGFKGVCLMDMLTNIESTEVTIAMANQDKPGVFTPTVQNEGEDILMLLMPMILPE